MKEEYNWVIIQELIEELLLMQKQFIKLGIKSDCMSPLITKEDNIIISKIHQKPQIGDIVILIPHVPTEMNTNEQYRNNKEPVVHRIVARNKYYFISKADAACKFDIPICQENIVAKVIAIEKKINLLI